MRKLDLLPILLLAISSNGDNVAVGVAYGLGRINVPLSSNLLIAVVTGVCTLASMMVGQGVGRLMSPRLANGVGGAIIAAIGVWVIVQSVQTHRGCEPLRETPSPQGALRRLMHVLDNPVGVDCNFSRQIEPRESWLLAIALSLNNTINGVAAGMVGMNPILLTAAVMLFSVLTLAAGLVAGGQLGRRWLGGFSGVLSGLMLMLLGLYELRV